MNKTSQIKIPIAFICDDKYAMPTSVTLSSLFKNKKKDTFYDIYLLGIDINNDNRIKLLSQNALNFSIKILEFQNKFKDIVTLGHVTTAALFKFDIANIINIYDKILYLDSDIIIQDDLSELYKTNIENVYAGVVRDLPCEKENMHKKFNLNFYFNSGVLLLNLKKIREEKLSEKLIEAKKNVPNQEFMDQDTFNIVFNNKVVLLSCKYNYFASFKNSNQDQTIADFYKISKAESSKIRHYPTITHFAAFKPWQKFCVIDRKLWYKYYKKSPYKEQKITYKENSSEKIKWRIKNIMNSFKRSVKVIINSINNIYK